MKIKVAAISAVAVFALAACSYAQAPAETQSGQAPSATNRPAVQRQARQGQGMQSTQALRDLGLTRDQIKKIRELVTGYNTEARTISQSTSTPEEKATKLKDLKTKTAAAINEVFTEEQRTKAAKDNLVEKILTPRHSVPGQGMGMFAQLNLTEEQKAKLKPIVEENAKAVQAVRTNSSLTPEAKREQMQKINKDYIEKVKAVLTADQIKQLEDIMSRVRNGARNGARNRAGSGQQTN